MLWTFHAHPKELPTCGKWASDSDVPFNFHDLPKPGNHSYITCPSSKVGNRVIKSYEYMNNQAKSYLQVGSLNDTQVAKLI